MSLTPIIAIMVLTVNYSFAQHQHAERTKVYANVRGEYKVFSKKLKVEDDLGDSPQQVKVGEEYSEILTNLTSTAAVLNFLAEKQFELVEALELSLISQGSRDNSGFVFIMMRKQERSSFSFDFSLDGKF